MKRGVFIVFDGIDGTGKTTQVDMLSDWLKKKGFKVLSTHEPTRNTKIGRYIERLIRSDNKPSSSELLRLYTEDRKAHLKNEIIPALKKGVFVVNDRYYYSTFAYQLPKSKWGDYAKNFLKPDITFICDLNEKDAMKRIDRSILQNERRFKKKAIFEKEKTLKQLRKKFLAMRRFKEVRIIDSKPLPDKIFKKIKQEMLKLKK